MASLAAILVSELASHVTTAIQTGDWSALDQVMESGQLTDQQKVRAIVEVTKSAGIQQLSQHVIPYCSSAHLNSAMTELISAGLWTEVWNLSQCVGYEHREWQVDNISVSNHLLAIVAKGRWKELGAVLQKDLKISPAQKRWALLQACQRAAQLEVIENILPQCPGKDLGNVFQELVSRALWWAVRSLFSQRRAVSETLRTWGLHKAAEEATPWEFSGFILPHCTIQELLSESKLLVARRLWWIFGDLLKKHCVLFVECMLPAFGNADTDLFMTHLWNERQLKNVRILLMIAGTQKSHWRIGDVTVPGKLIQLAAGKRWTALVFEAHGSKNPAEIAWAMEEMSKRAGKNEINRINTCVCPISEIPSMISNLVTRGFMKEAALLLCRMVSETMEKWVETIAACKLVCQMMGGTVEESLVNANSTVKNNEQAFWSLLRKAFDLRDVFELCLKVSEVTNIYVSVNGCSDIIRKGSFYASALPLLTKVLFDSALNIIVVSLCDPLSDSSLSQAEGHQVQSTLTEILKDIDAVRGNIYYHPLLEMRPVSRVDSTSHPVFALSFILAVVKHCHVQEQWSLLPGHLLAYLTTIPVVPEIQRHALRIMLEKNALSYLRLSDLSCVGEQVRRLLFSSAMKQKQWQLVKQWADHDLNDDQRSWALECACKEKQWDVYLHLAEHGLSEDELIRVHYNIVLNADTKTVRDMYEHETDVVEVKELITKSISNADTSEKLLGEGSQIFLSDIERKLKSRMTCFKTLETAVDTGDWQIVVLSFRQGPTADKLNTALKAAVAGQAWRAVRQLVRLGIQVSDPHSFFLDMMENHQWSVCRILIEQGLSAELHRDVLPKLMELNQWGLVGRMMDREVEDRVRRQVMNWALQRKEGSVVSKCIMGMTQGLTLQEREDLFHRAVIHGALQALVPLVKEQDNAGIRHRDVALLHAIREQQWDVVDVCLHHQADINVLDDNGESPIHRAAQAGDWDTVLAIAERGGDSSLLDRTGLSVLHTAIQTQQWKSVNKLIDSGCNLQQSAQHNTEKRTVLQMLLNSFQGDIINTALFPKKPEIWQGQNSRGETSLHTICLFDRYNDIPLLLTYGADPLSVTCRGNSALAYAVLSRDTPWLTVAKCISLGFGTHQPHITHTVKQTRELNVFLSPVLFAVLRGLPSVTHMLYESGSCSLQELSQSLPHLCELTDSDSWAHTTLGSGFRTEMSAVCPNREYSTTSRRVNRRIQKSSQYLTRVSSTPRSLKSTCRLVISHCLQIGATRTEDIDQLPIPISMKDYLRFSDLDGQKDTLGTYEVGDEEEDVWRTGYGEDEEGPTDEEEQWFHGYGYDEDEYTDEEEQWFHGYGYDEDEYTDEEEQWFHGYAGL